MSNAFEETLQDAANHACDLAFANATEDLKTLRGGRMCFYPIVDVEDETIGVGVNPDYHYLVYQNRGFASYPMTSCFGKTIPMYINGKLIFRKCTGINQFRSGHKNYWQRDIDGNLIPVYQQRRAWVHPGLPPKHFIEDAIDESLLDYQESIDEAIFYDRWSEYELEYDRGF